MLQNRFHPLDQFTIDDKVYDAESHNSDNINRVHRKVNKQAGPVSFISTNNLLVDFEEVYDKVNCKQDMSIKNHVGGDNNTKNKGECVSKYGSNNYTDKYELELSFKSKYRKKIAEAKDCEIFNLWDTQNEGKFVFIPLGDQMLPIYDAKNPLMDNIIELHEAVKSVDKFNFTGSQIQVKSQLRLEIWDQYLADYWDKQLLCLIRYGFPLEGFPLAISLIIINH